MNWKYNINCKFIFIINIFLQEQKRVDAQSALPDNLEYTNTNNPFNDMNLTQTFVWGKKLEKEGKNNLTEKQIERE